MQVLSIAGVKMIPFVKSVTVYFALGAYRYPDEKWATLAKCAPIVFLIVFIVMYGNALPRRSTYAHNILLGLVFSCIGDGLLNHDYFAPGMAAFGIAQIFYIIAFQTQLLKIWIACVLYAGGITTVLLLRQKLEPTILIGLPIYTFLLLTMCWRSIVRACDPKYNTSSAATICAVGSVLFVISDTLIAFDRFNAPIPNSTILIMLTYYMAQFAITLSIVDIRQHTNSKLETDNIGLPNIDSIDNSNITNVHRSEKKSTRKNK